MIVDSTTVYTIANVEVVAVAVCVAFPRLKVS